MTRDIRQIILDFHKKGACHHRQLDFRESDLRAVDLRGIDLTGVNLRGADLSEALLDGAWLQGALLEGASFQGITINTLLCCGLSPLQIFRLRNLDEHEGVSPIMFSQIGRFKTTKRECSTLCQVFGTLAWEQITNEDIFSVLFPNKEWQWWMGRCRSRPILEWILAYEKAAEIPLIIPFYGKMRLLDIIQDIEDQDLVAGLKSNVRHVLIRVGQRRLERLQAQEVIYPPSPFGEDAAVEYISRPQRLYKESIEMNHCVATLEDRFLQGQCFLYHIGPPGSQGSMLSLSPTGIILQHRARFNANPSAEQKLIVSTWLKPVWQQQTPHFISFCDALSRGGIVLLSFLVSRDRAQGCIVVDHFLALDAEQNPCLISPILKEKLLSDVLPEQGDHSYGSWSIDTELYDITKVSFE